MNKYKKWMVVSFFAVLLAILAVVSVGAYGPWQPDPDPDPPALTISLEGINDTIARLEAAIELAERNRAAHPDFLADLWAILAQLKDERDVLAWELDRTGTPPSAQPGSAQRWSFSGSLSQADPSARYPIQLAANGDLFLTVTTGQDLNLYGGVFLLDSDGENRLYRSTQGPGTTREHHVPNLRAGTYYVELVKDGRTFYFGPFSAEVHSRPASLANASGQNWSQPQAYPLPLNTTISGHLGFRGQPQPPQMESWYRISLPSNGHVTLTVTTSGEGSGGFPAIRPTDGSLNLFGGVFLLDSDGEARLFSTNHGPGREQTYQIDNLRADTYYVRIAKDGRAFYWGTYTLRAEAIPFSRTADPEPNDSARDPGVGAIRVGQTVTGDLGTRGQGLPPDTQDYWRYEHSGGRLVFAVETSGGDGPDAADGDLNLHGGIFLYAARNLEQRVFSTVQGPGTRNQYEVANLAPGTYYFHIQKDGRAFYYGTYSLTILAAGR